MIAEKLKHTDLLLLDVDGVLTRGTLIYSDNGSELKMFNVKDGLGMRLLMESGIQIGIVTGRKSPALMHRCQDLGIETIYTGITDKAALLNRICEETGILPNRMAFMGDDLPDLPLMNAVGLSITVADAHPIIIDQADMTTRAPGGAGAVREVCEAILKSRSMWDAIINRYHYSKSKQ